MLLTIPQVEVLIHRQRQYEKQTGILKAWCVQKNSQGLVRGRNLLSGRQFTRISTAQNYIQSELGGRVSSFLWKVEDYGHGEFGG